LLDADGIRSRDPVRLSLGAVPDEAPQVNVQLEGISTAITANAKLPVAGEIADDYGLAKTWFSLTVDTGKQQREEAKAADPDAKPGNAKPDDPAARRVPLKTAPEGRNKVAVREELEVGPLELKPKQRLHFIVQAADSYALEAAPNVGSSQRYVLDVVTPEQLRGMLEARELLLRRRYETMINEFSDTRDLLARLELSPTKNADKEKKAAAKKDAGKPAASNAEPGDAPDADQKRSPEERLAAELVQAERVLQNTQRTAHDLVEIADSFDAIRLELINNRVDTEELKTRLKDGIADPLHAIAANRFPPLEKMLRELQAQLASPESAGRLQTASLAQADAALVEMRQVLDRMLELETFNEVLEMLRSVIAAQEKLNDATKAQQKQKAKALLDDED
jgi:hypothetical protein